MCSARQPCSEQSELHTAERQAARDTTLALAPLLNSSDGDPNPSREEALRIKQQIEVLQGQLLLVDTLLQSMQFDQVAHQCKSDPGAFVRAAYRARHYISEYRRASA